MRSMKTLTAIALALGLAVPAALSSYAIADEVGLDANADGMIEGDEWGDYRNQFSAWDANQDSMIDEDEWNEGAQTSFGGEPGGGDDDGPLFGWLDTTDDNQIGEDEFFSDDSFTGLDDNEDGVLDQDEFGL